MTIRENLFNAFVQADLESMRARDRAKTLAQKLTEAEYVAAHRQALGLRLAELQADIAGVKP